MMTPIDRLTPEQQTACLAWIAANPEPPDEPSAPIPCECGALTLVVRGPNGGPGYPLTGSGSTDQRVSLFERDTLVCRDCGKVGQVREFLLVKDAPGALGRIDVDARAMKLRSLGQAVAAAKAIGGEGTGKRRETRWVYKLVASVSVDLDEQETA